MKIYPREYSSTITTKKSVIFLLLYSTNSVVIKGIDTLDLQETNMFAAPQSDFSHAAPMSCAYQVSLIDRRTGRAHRVSGSPLVRFTHDPQSAVRELLDGRDSRLWETRIEPLDPYAR